VKEAVLRKINSIILHCSSSDIPGHDNIETIRKWHVEERGWSDVGYGFYIRKSGQLEIGRPISKAGAHARGYNSNSVGICLGGLKNFQKEQFLTLYQLSRNLIDIFGIEENGYFGHNVVDANKTCPNFDVGPIKDLLWKKKKV